MKKPKEENYGIEIRIFGWLDRHPTVIRIVILPLFAIIIIIFLLLAFMMKIFSSQ